MVGNAELTAICLQFVGEMNKGRYVPQFNNEIIEVNNLLTALDYAGTTDSEAITIQERLNTLLRNLRVYTEYTQGIFYPYFNIVV